nr:lipopolysaccharide assembly protein LapB [Spongiibacter thalassae]
MMDSGLLPYLFLLLAVIIGWLLGRYSRSEKPDQVDQEEASYYRGLRFLLSEQPGTAVDQFIDAIPVSEDSLPTHLSLANLMRSKGELEAATRIHQNLLSRPTLPQDKLHQVHLELAKDYISAGLLDRAERLLRDLAEESESWAKEALEQLQHIYQAERDWLRAVAVARRRLPKPGWLLKAKFDEAQQAVATALSHYHCELAEQALSNGRESEARKELQHARQMDKDNVRACLMMARLSLREQPQYSLNLLHRLAESQSAYAAEVLPIFREAFLRMSDADAYQVALQQLANVTGSAALHIEVARLLRESSGDAEARRYLLEAARQRPNLGILTALLASEGSESSEVLAPALKLILKETPQYRCRRCGFSGRKLHWLCPSCEQWGTIAPIRGTQGD